MSSPNNHSPPTGDPQPLVLNSGGSCQVGGARSRSWWMTLLTFRRSMWSERLQRRATVRCFRAKKNVPNAMDTCVIAQGGCLTRQTRIDTGCECAGIFVHMDLFCLHFLFSFKGQLIYFFQVYINFPAYTHGVR